MEPDRIRSSVIARLVGFDELRPPQQTSAKKQRFSSDHCQSEVAKIGAWGKNYLPKQDADRQKTGFVSMGNKESGSDFLVSPTKELCRAYLRKPTLFASKHVIVAQATPPHKREKCTKVTASPIHGGTVSRVNGTRAGQQSSESRLKFKHHNRIDLVKPRIGKKDSTTLRSFSPVTAPRASHLGDRKRGQYVFLENKAKERKKLSNGATPGKGKERYSGETVSNSTMGCTSWDMASSLGQIGSETLDAEVKLRLPSSPHFTSKDDNDNDNSLHCAGTCLECQESLEEGNQPSPVSVLEPIFDGETLEDFGKLPHLDFLGLEQQLETLTSESVETYSEGSGMVVSSDGESEEESILDFETKEKKKDNNVPIGSWSVQESRDSSYTDDVLAEFGFENGEFFSQWDSSDLPISTKIFEKLEKKYIHHHTSWRRSERRLLLDRVTSGLIEIVESYVAAAPPRWKKPVARRLGAVLSTQRLKQELWKLLEGEDKRAKKEPSDIDEGLELEADAEPVVREMEAMLVDELLDELVGIACRV